MSHHVHVFTFKEGVLSRVAHDLRLHVERFTIEVEGTRVHASLDPASFVVDGVMQNGRLDATGIGTRDKAKIGQNIREEILRTSRHPKIEFHGTLEPETLRVAGELELVGVRRPVVVAATRDGDRLHATVILRPSDYGIAPYKALAGAIRVQDRVRIELDLAASLVS